MEKDEEEEKRLKPVYWMFVCALILAGCSKDSGAEEKVSVEEGKDDVTEEKSEAARTEEEKTEEPEMEPESAFMEADAQETAECAATEPEIVDADWSEYFDGLNGAAVVYDVSGNCDISDWEGPMEYEQ